jgi:PAS domain S-box-containing protein
MIDQTERVAAEERRKASELRLSRMLEIAPDAIIAVGADQRIQLFNRTAEEIFGYAAAEVVGEPLDLLIPHRFRRMHRRHVVDFSAVGDERRYISERPEIAGLRKDGSEFPAEASISKLEMDGELVLIVMLRDITERKQAEAKNQRFLDAIDQLSGAIALYDADDRLVTCNEQYRQISGSVGEMIKPGLLFEDLLRLLLEHQEVPEADTDVEAWLAERMQRHREPKGPFEVYRDGRWYRVQETRLSDGGTIAAALDISAEKKRDEELRQSQKLEAIGQLTGGIAHDFNNILAVIMGNLGLLEDDLDLDREHGLLVNRTKHAVDRAAELTRRMLAFAREQPLEAKRVNVNEVLETAEHLLRRSLTAEIDIDILMAPDLAACLVDPVQLEQAVLNLAINARDAMPKGGRLRLETANVALPLDQAGYQADLPAGDHVMIVVADTGVGISSELHQQIFEPFFTTKDVGKGTGLGLSMVYGFVKQSGGDITVDSQPDHGTTFRIFLPRATGPALAAEKPAAARTALANGDETVLLVEDDPDVQVMVARTLRKNGYHVLVAGNGQEGLDILSDGGQVDLLLTDVMLPGGLNGRQLAGGARALAPSLKVLFMSGYSKDAIVEEGRLHPDGPLLVKPFLPSDLVGTVRELLDGT